MRVTGISQIIELVLHFLAMSLVLNERSKDTIGVTELVLTKTRTVTMIFYANNSMCEIIIDVEVCNFSKWTIRRSLNGTRSNESLSVSIGIFPFRNNAIEHLILLFLWLNTP